MSYKIKYSNIKEAPVCHTILYGKRELISFIGGVM